MWVLVGSVVVFVFGFFLPFVTEKSLAFIWEEPM